MTRFSWQRLDDGGWGVKASADLGQAARYAGQTVDVTKRDGSSKRVTLGGLVDRWNGDRAAVYAVAGRRAPAQPRVWSQGGDDYDQWEKEDARRQTERDNAEYAAGVNDAKRWQENRAFFGQAAADAIEFDRDMRGLNGDW